MSELNVNNGSGKERKIADSSTTAYNAIWSRIRRSEYFLDKEGYGQTNLLTLVGDRRYELLVNSFRKYRYLTYVYSATNKCLRSKLDESNRLEPYPRAFKQLDIHGFEAVATIAYIVNDFLGKIKRTMDDFSTSEKFYIRLALYILAWMVKHIKGVTSEYCFTTNDEFFIRIHQGPYTMVVSEQLIIYSGDKFFKDANHPNREIRSAHPISDIEHAGEYHPVAVYFMIAWKGVYEEDIKFKKLIKTADRIAKIVVTFKNYKKLYTNGDQDQDEETKNVDGESKEETANEDPNPTPSSKVEDLNQKKVEWMMENHK